MVVGLQAVFGFDVGGEIRGGEVGVLTAGLDITIQLLGGNIGSGFLTRRSMLCMYV